MRAFLIAGLVLFSPLRAGGLEAARAAVSHLAAQSPLAGHLAEIYRKDDGGAKAAQSLGGAQLSVEVQANPSGLVLSWDQGLLHQADAEERARDREANGAMPLREAMKELDPGRVAHLLDQRASILGLLAQGTLLRAEDVTYEGQPARKLELSVPVRVSDDRLRARVSSSEGRLTLWLGADSVPLASELHLSYQGRMGRIFGRFEGRSVLRTKYGREGDRLFVAHRDSWESLADESGDRTITLTLDFQKR